MPPALRVHRLRRCPKCGDITVFPSHCPQLDGYTLTVGCDVVALDDLRRATLAELAALAPPSRPVPPTHLRLESDS